MMLLLLLLAWPSVCVVCPNYEVVVLQPLIGTAPYLGSLAIFTTILDAPAPPVSTVSEYLVFTPVTGSYLPPVFRPLTLLRSLVAPNSPTPPQLAWAQSDRPHGRRPHPPASTSHLCLPPSPSIHKEFLARSCVFRPLSCCPPPSG